MQYHEIFRRAKEFIAQEGGDIAPLPISEEELNPSEQEDLSLSAYPLESMDMCYRVPYVFPEDSTCSEFSFFEDGRQRTVQIGFIQAKYGDHSVMIPVHFFVVAAVILERDQREFRLWGEPEIKQGIFIESSLVPDQRLLKAFGDMIVDVPGNGGDYYQLRKNALQAAKKYRLEAENKLIVRWRQSERASSNFLIVDGTLMNLRNEDNVERCVGVSKSFGSRYFNVSDHNRVLRMKEFERSWTFRFHSPDDAADDSRLGSRERISWYLRLRSRPNVDPEFGLIRVEISQRHAGLASEYANRFSRSLLSERLPTAYPAPRWDKHLYPIQACENYLTSIMPSVSTIAASMKG